MMEKPVGKPRRKFPPLLLRIQLYHRVLELSSQGLNVTEISEKIIQEYGVHISERQIRQWIRGVSSPYGHFNNIRVEGPELAYIIGALLSDGYVYEKYEGRKGARQRVGLEVKDEEYADQLIRNLQAISIKPRKMMRRNGFIIVEANSIILYQLIKTGEWRKHINTIGEKTAFLKAFFDGDGTSLFPSYINTDLEKLEYIKELLTSIGIRTSTPILINEKGTTWWNNRTKKWITRKRDVYELYIHPEDYEKFLRRIGTSISRKRRLIKLSIKIVRHYMGQIMEKEDWWEVCRRLRAAIGRVIKSKKRKSNKPHPSNLFPLTNLLSQSSKIFLLRVSGDYEHSILSFARIS